MVPGRKVPTLARSKSLRAPRRSKAVPGVIPTGVIWESAADKIKQRPEVEHSDRKLNSASMLQKSPVAKLKAIQSADGQMSWDRHGHATLGLAEEGPSDTDIAKRPPTCTSSMLSTPLRTRADQLWSGDDELLIWSTADPHNEVGGYTSPNVLSRMTTPVEDTDGSAIWRRADMSTPPNAQWQKRLANVHPSHLHAAYGAGGTNPLSATYPLTRSASHPVEGPRRFNQGYATQQLSSTQLLGGSSSVQQHQMPPGALRHQLSSAAPLPQPADRHLEGFQSTSVIDLRIATPEAVPERHSYQYPISNLSSALTMSKARESERKRSEQPQVSRPDAVQWLRIEHSVDQGLLAAEKVRRQKESGAANCVVEQQQEALSAAAVPPATELARWLMEKADRLDRNGELTMVELMAFLPHHPFTEWFTRQRQNLLRYDRNKDGSISLQELESSCAEFIALQASAKKGHLAANVAPSDATPLHTGIAAHAALHAAAALGATAQIDLSDAARSAIAASKELQVPHVVNIEAPVSNHAPRHRKGLCEASFTEAHEAEAHVFDNSHEGNMSFDAIARLSVMLVQAQAKRRRRDNWVGDERAYEEMIEKKNTYTLPVGHEWLTAAIGMLYLCNPLLLAQDQAAKREQHLEQVPQLLCVLVTLHASCAQGSGNHQQKAEQLQCR